jgi:RNA polymerase sigma factor (sigma-70 family)
MSGCAWPAVATSGQPLPWSRTPVPNGGVGIGKWRLPMMTTRLKVAKAAISDRLAIPKEPCHVPLDVLRRRPAADGLTDEMLLSGLAMGEAGMEVAFVRRFQRRVYGLALSLVGDAALAEDISQEALLRAWRHASVFDSRRGSVATWLLSITRNLAIDSLRVRRAVPTVPEELIGLPEHAKGPEDSAIEADAASTLRKVVATLPVEQRRALVLAAFYGQTAAEISSSEGIPLGTAKTRIRAGMLKLRAAMIEQKAVS